MIDLVFQKQIPPLRFPPQRAGSLGTPVRSGRDDKLHKELVISSAARSAKSRDLLLRSLWVPGAMTNCSHFLFWDVDTQFDFMDPAGKLYVPGAEKILDRIFALNSWAGSHNVLLISSVDAHQPDDPELAQYGLHCMAGTPGQAKQPDTLLKPHCILPNRKVPLPDIASCRHIIVEKQEIDVFTNPNVDALLDKLGSPLHVVLYGVVTEICVSMAARGLIRRGHTVDIVTDAVRHLDINKAERTIEEIMQHGGRVLETADVLSGRAARAA